jgi:hypothetical protein
MADRQLIIVVSDILRRWDYLDITEPEKDVLQVGDRHFAVQQEFPKSSDPWKDELREAILKYIRDMKDWKSVELRVAIHASTFYGSSPNPQQTRDQRFPREEKLIQQSLDEDLDVQVWAFHHDPEISDLWAVMQQAPDIPSDDDTRKLNFFQQLDDTFRKLSAAAAEAAPIKEAQRMWEELSVIRHQIIGLFDPTRLRLESAREKGPAEAAVIKAGVESSLDGKRGQAQSLLKRAQRFAPSEASAKCISDLKTHLDKIDLQNFTSWLRSLDDKLNLFRSTVTGRQ